MWEEVFFMPQDLRERTWQMEERNHVRRVTWIIVSILCWQMLSFQNHIFDFFFENLCKDFPKTLAANIIENKKTCLSDFFAKVRFFESFHQKKTKQMKKKNVHSFQSKNASESIQKLSRSRCELFWIEIKHLIFCHFHNFSSFFNCACHSRSRHIDFSWHFETTILHHLCRTSREMILFFHVNVNFFHTHQFFDPKGFNLEPPVNCQPSHWREGP